MRQIASFIALFAVLLIGLTQADIQPASGQFATNTPAPNTAMPTSLPPTENGPQNATAVPTEDGSTSGGGIFATNTVSGPTNTPESTATDTVTATPSATPSSTPTATPTSTDTPSPTPTQVGPYSYPEGINPLTGLPYLDEEAMQRRNLIVKISNYPPLVRPQYGVNSADVVYEYEAEGGVTRFAAIFRSQSPGRVGSVRSGRLMDIQLATMYRALLAYSGTSQPIQDLFLGEGFFDYQLLSPSIGHDCETDGFCRDEELRQLVPFEHTLFGDTDKMWQTATRQGANTGWVARGFSFAEEPDPNGTPANDIFINWYGQTDARWQYDEETSRYLRYTDSVPHYDKGDGEQLWVDNIVIIVVPHERRPDLFEPGAKNESLEIQLWGQNLAYVVRDGEYWNGYWRRENEEQGTALQLIYGNNQSIKLKPGRTWVEVVRGFGDVTISEQQADMVATATILAQTPSPTPIETHPD
ncbi:DUF3048 domain-containing protein [Phototrophicus methaneseepsis]|uniref:DUF3048 domain-containing protein n=1 Tax=Phototrophicus methaneseepsis TaxID=2710758 RepID=A0A7S8E7K0_9CHLR|nr:DUF3048 domain-containing protein [Phototrophicus methaneseepsis]QPC81804.1 DUF3048 domain-containing protein [Phototrophicus methaneseepsis]